MENKATTVGKLITKLVFEENISKRKVLANMAFDAMQEHLEDDKKFIREVRDYRKSIRDILLK